MFEEGKTLYQIDNESGEITTITIDKWVADLLQEMLPDVHAWVQTKYDRIVKKLPQLSRRERGDLLREIARKEVAAHPKVAEYFDL